MFSVICFYIYLQVKYLRLYADDVTGVVKALQMAEHDR